MQYLLYVFFRGIVCIIRLMPQWMTSVCAFSLYFICYRLLRLRRKVVRKNLVICFPDKTPAERKKIEKQHYYHLATLLVESATMSFMDLEEAKKCVTITNVDLIQSYLDQQKSVMVWAGHMHNIEYYNIGGAYYSLIAVYKGIRNVYIDRWFRQNRSSFGASLIATNQFRQFIQETNARDQQGQPCVFGLIADQKPGKQNSLSVDFFNRRTDFFIGPELFADRYDLPMVYLSMQRVKDGRYTTTFHPLEKISGEFGERTQQAVSLLEKDIKQSPAQYFWLHNRWKHIETISSDLIQQV